MRGVKQTPLHPIPPRDGVTPSPEYRTQSRDRIDQSRNHALRARAPLRRRSAETPAEARTVARGGTDGGRTETHAEPPQRAAEPRRASQRGREGAQMPEGGRDAETRPAEAERATETRRDAETHHGRQRQTQTQTHPPTHTRTRGEAQKPREGAQSGQGRAKALHGYK